MMPEPEVSLRADCTRCAGLCCVLLAFDEGEDFGFAKPAGQACRHLKGHLCTIHDGLAEAGFAGCRHYDCLGAGQRVVQEVFGGQSWRQDPALLAGMEQAFRALRRLHEDHGLLLAAARLALTPGEESRRLALLADLDLSRRRDAPALAAYLAGPLPRAVKSFLAELTARLRPRR